MKTHLTLMIMSFYRKIPDGFPFKESETDDSISGIVQTYFLELKERLSREITLHKMPLCYHRAIFGFALLTIFL